MSRGIEVVIAWGSRVLGVRTISRTDSLGLAELVGSLPVPGEVLRSVRHPLVAFRANCPHVVIPPSARGWIERAGAPSRSLDELHHEGHPFRSAPRPVFPSGTEVALTSDTTVQLEMGMLTLRVSCSARESHSLVRRRAPIDRRLAACCVAAGVLLLGALGGSASAMPPSARSTELDVLPGTLHVTLTVMQDELFAEDEPGLQLALGPTDNPKGKRGQTCRCASGGPMGCVDAEPSSARYGIAGPADNPDPHISRAWLRGDMAPSIWPILTPPYAWLDEAPTAPWGRDDSFGTDAISARGNMWGDSVGEAKGSNGLGLVNDHGGLTKVLSSNGSHADGTTRPPRVTHSGLRVLGARKPSAILPVVATRFSGFAACYTTALASTPDLGGRVDLTFQIDPSGAVSHVAARSAAITDPALSSCLVSAVSGLSFQTSATSFTTVTYPLLLQP